MYSIAIRRIYGPYRGTYTNIAKTAIASLYFQCYNPISYSGHPRGSTKYRLAKMWGAGRCTRVISDPRPKWCRANKLCLNVKKTKYILFGPNIANIVRQSRDLDILIDGKTVDQISHTNSDKPFKFLGIYIDETLSWRYHLQKVCTNIKLKLYYQ